MNMQSIINFCEKSDTLSDSDLDVATQIREYASAMADSGKSIVVEKLTEAKFSKTVAVLESALLAEMIANGQGKGILLEKMSGSLQAFSHTLILTMLGILADEEVI